MHYKFPHIEYITDVLSAISDKKEFIVAEKDGYTVINYVIAGEDTFPEVTTNRDAILRECRGITFRNTDGRIIARKFHKFFNLGEREETKFDNLDITQKHHIPHKLDGSMITPVLVPTPNGDEILQWHTKMGHTDIAKQVEKFVADHREYIDFATFVTINDQTPIFEWCSPKNKIVIDHQEDHLILLAIRENVSGCYVARDTTVQLATRFGIEFVPLWNANTLVEAETLDEVKASEEHEGVVITFHTGHMVKVKSDWYVQIHRTKDQIQSERHVANLITESKLDDLIPLLDANDSKVVQEYNRNFFRAVIDMAATIVDAVYLSRGLRLARKDFALTIAKAFPSKVHSVLFRVWQHVNESRLAGREDETDFDFANFEVLGLINKNSLTNKSFAEVKEAIFPDIVYRGGMWSTTVE